MSGPPVGIGILSAGIILAIMIIPFIAAVMRDVFEITPPMLKESAYGVGATTWEVVWRVVLPYTKAGVIGGVMLGLGRALGETMAVTFVIGNFNQLETLSLFEAANSITSALANEFAEATPGLHEASLIYLGLILFLITFVVLSLHKSSDADEARQRERRHDALHQAGSSRRLSPAAAPAPQARQHDCAVAFAGRDGFRAGLADLDSVGRTGWGSRASARRYSCSDTPAECGRRRTANAIIGSLGMVLAATAVGTPIGILAGSTWPSMASAVARTSVTRFINDILLSAPSIVIGLFVYTIIVAQTRQFSAFAGIVALALIVIPVVIRTTENMLQLIPNALREATFALGAPKWIVIQRVTLKAARAGVVTGVLLAVARIAGETAPLLFTALSNQFFTLSLDQPMASLPVTIFKFAMSPFSNWQELAWVGVFIITVGVLVLNILARVLFRHTGTMESVTVPHRRAWRRASALKAPRRLPTSAQDEGARPEFLLRQVPSAEEHQSRDPREKGDGLYRTLGLRQVDAAAGVQPDVRAVSGAARRRRGQCRR